MIEKAFFSAQNKKLRSPASIARSVVLFPIWFPLLAYCVCVAAQFDRTYAFSRWLHGRYESYRHGGFTLIELSIVLVVIGLIVGGVLTGQDMIKASQLRATITQVEKFNAAVNTFRDKYGGLPGDLNATTAAQFGFVARSGAIGRGNGDFLLEGVYYPNGTYYGWSQAGEPLFFWEDLASAHLIDGGFSTATDAGIPTITATSIPNFDAYLPAAKLGNGNYFYVYSTGNNQGAAAMLRPIPSTISDYPLQALSLKAT